MFESKALASEISELMLKMSSDLSASLVKVKDQEGEEAIRCYQAAVGALLFTMLTQVMNPIYRDHPELRPERLK